MDLLRWSFAPENAAAVSGWGFWFGLVGLMITTGGFVVTWIRLAKTKTVAEAARAEAERIRATLNSYDAIQDATRAGYALAVTKKHLKNRAWNDAADSFDDVRRALISIRHNAPMLDIKLISELDKATLYITKFCERIEKDPSQDKATIDISKTNVVIRSHQDLVQQISSSVQKGMI